MRWRPVKRGLVVGPGGCRAVGIEVTSPREWRAGGAPGRGTIYRSSFGADHGNRRRRNSTNQPGCSGSGAAGGADRAGPRRYPPRGAVGVAGRASSWARFSGFGRGVSATAARIRWGLDEDGALARAWVQAGVAAPDRVAAMLVGR